MLTRSTPSLLQTLCRQRPAKVAAEQLRNNWTIDDPSVFPISAVPVNQLEPKPR